MIDLHCHLLPGIDDGPASVEESLALARSLVADGTRTVAATPHLRSDHPKVVVGELRDRSQELQRTLEDNLIPLEVISGAEVDVLWAHRAAQDDLELACYGEGRRTLLLETPYGPLPPGFPGFVDELIESGFCVLLAHPERSSGVQRQPRLLEDLIDRGALVQVTAASLTLNPARSASARTAHKLITRGHAHLIASDLHGPRSAARAPLSVGIARAEEVSPRWTRWMVTEGLEAILQGRPMSFPPVDTPGVFGRIRRAFR
jgi:protein-tyrosine phosphatase